MFSNNINLLLFTLTPIYLTILIDIAFSVSTHESEEKPKKTKYETKPLPAIRFDEKSHWIKIDEEKTGHRCKFENCGEPGKPGKPTRYFCEKCNVHLCLTAKRNCFRDFHVLNVNN